MPRCGGPIPSDESGAIEHPRLCELRLLLQDDFVAPVLELVVALTNLNHDHADTSCDEES